MSQTVDIKELNEKIERESAFVHTIMTGMNKVIVGQKHLVESLLIGLLSKRMRVSREIGHYKLEHDMPVLQTMRYDEILRDRAEQAERMDMSGDFIRKMLESIHEESVRQQLAIMENAKKENQSNQSNTI
jgi:chorismate mutase